VPSVPTALQRSPDEVSVAEQQASRAWWPWRRGEAGDGGGPALNEAQQGYARVALELLARCDELHERWLEQVDEQRHNERLANAAAVYHWYLSGIRERLTAAEVPPSLGTWHEVLLTALDGAYQATRLMSHGYRFHDVRRICDGGLLLEEARAQVVAVRDALAKLAGQPARPLAGDSPAA
jgi:hypothetical protein